MSQTSLLVPLDYQKEAYHLIEERKMQIECPHCGELNFKGGLFCSHCGKQMAVE
jgi:DNA-directed RNA polymerase subunit RPC12/RpoP